MEVELKQVLSGVAACGLEVDHETAVDEAFFRTEERAKHHLSWFYLEFGEKGFL
jgi:hypothetical protein